MDSFLEPQTSDEKARAAASAEIKDEVGKFKNARQAEIRKLKKARRAENIPSKQASLEQQISEKEQEFTDVDCVFNSGKDARQDHYRQLIKWNEIMKKHGVAGY